MAKVIINRATPIPPPISSVTLELSKHEARAIATWVNTSIPSGRFGGPRETIAQAMLDAGIDRYNCKEDAYGPVDK